MPSIIPVTGGKNGYYIIPTGARNLDQCVFVNRDSEVNSGRDVPSGRLPHDRGGLRPH